MAEGKPGRGSDQFPLRLPDGMRDALKAAADENGRSMNAEIVVRLRSSFAEGTHERGRKLADAAPSMDIRQGAQMTDHSNVRRFLDLSTAHLSPVTRRIWDMAYGRPGWLTPTGHGFWVWAGDASDPDTDNDLPEEAVACRKFARSLGCDYLLFDCDASEIEGLATYDD